MMPTVVSLFSGAGGLDLGIELAGGDILAQVEMDPSSVETLRLRAAATGKSTQVYGTRIEDIDAARVRVQVGLRRGELDLLAGGPPCQPFTTTGRRRAISDARASSLFPRYLKYVDEFEPSALLIENVDGMLSAALRHRPLAFRTRKHAPLTWEERKGSFLQWLLNELAMRGYSVSWGVVEAADYGVPQLRQRALLIGVRGDGPPCFLPVPEYGQAGQPRYRTLRQALSGIDDLGPIQRLSERKRTVFSLIPPGGNWRDLPPDQQAATMGAAYLATGGKSGWWRRLSWDAPSPTILGMPDHSSTALIHPDEVRCLSVRECAAVQSFPAGMQFGGKPRAQYQQIGNAVPPLLARSAATQIFRRLAGRTQEFPQAPGWRKTSANRRIGTHGWVTYHQGHPEFHIITKVREDHVWAGSYVRDQIGLQLAS